MRASKTKRELNARFMEKVKVVNDRHSCWEWQGSVSNGYGMFWVPSWLLPDQRRGRMYTAHRVAYWLAQNDWPGPRGNDVCHSCDNPICVRPTHLWLGTHAENMADSSRKGRVSRQGAPAGEASPLHKLSDADVRAIYDRAWAGERHASIAADFNVTMTMVSHIKRGARRASAIRPPCIHCGDTECRSLSVCC